MLVARVFMDIRKKITLSYKPNETNTKCFEHTEHFWLDYYFMITSRFMKKVWNL